MKLLFTSDWQVRYKRIFLRYVDKTDYCWVWIGATDARGYGRVPFVLHKLGSTLAHRISWLLFRGKITKDKPLVLHHCDNPPCVRPKHLFVGTQKDNVNDMAEKFRHGRAKLSAEIVIRIRHSSKGLKWWSNKIGLSKVAIWRVKKKLTYSHVKEQSDIL